MPVAVLDKNVQKQQLLDDLRDTLIELDEKRKSTDYMKEINKPLWRDLFTDEED